MTATQLDHCDVLILCGGQGTRLRAVVSDRPKPMVLVEGRPFIDRVIESYVRQGVRRVILCTGYMADQFTAWYAKRARDYELVFSEETSPLGTAGAMQHAAHLIRSNPFLVVNGDSLCETPLEALLACHAAHRGCATVTLTAAGQRTDVGFVTMDQEGRITAFAEKHSGNAARFHNAGIYVCDQSILDRIPAQGPYSLETDLFPQLVPQQLYGFVCDAPLYDIGTPERLEEFRQQAGTSSSRAHKGVLPCDMVYAQDGI